MLKCQHGGGVLVRPGIVEKSLKEEQPRQPSLGQDPQGSTAPLFLPAPITTNLAPEHFQQKAELLGSTQSNLLPCHREENVDVNLSINVLCLQSETERILGSGASGRNDQHSWHWLGLMEGSRTGPAQIPWQPRSWGSVKKACIQRVGKEGARQLESAGTSSTGGPGTSKTRPNPRAGSHPLTCKASGFGEWRRFKRSLDSLLGVLLLIHLYCNASLL